MAPPHFPLLDQPLTLAGLTHVVSLAVHRMRVSGAENRQGHGTAFFYRHEGRPYVVTNWHVLTGRPPSNPASAGAWLPEGATYTASVPYEFGWLRPETQLRLTDPFYRETDWFEHPSRSTGVDVAVIEHQGSNPICINDHTPPDASLSEAFFADIHPGMDVFVVGFPLDLSQNVADPPIWKRASLATQPRQRFANLPAFIVDSATYSGMSGSPVILLEGPSTPKASGTLPASPRIRLLGVYSGRQRIGEQAAQLGMVWDFENVIQTIEGQRRAGSQF